MVSAELEIEDGIHPGMAREEYCHIKAANYSTIKHFSRTPAHAREMMLHPPDPTPQMELGTATHCAVFEPSRFAEEYIVAPKVDKRTKAGKEEWAAFEEANRHKSLLDLDEMDQCQGMMKQAYEHEIAKQLLSSPGKAEVAVVWTDKRTGVRCKALLDRIILWAGWTVVLDLKTTRNAGPWEFSGQVAKLWYHEQAAFYLDGLNTIAQAERRFMWIAAESERPYCVAVYEPDQEALQAGRSAYQAHLDAYQSCRESNSWPGYPASIQPLSLPRWAQPGD